MSAKPRMPATPGESLARRSPGGNGAAGRRTGVVRVLALGARIAAYLAWTSLSQRGLPLGCGAGSGCSEVLRSRWGTLLGLPIAAYALGAYLLVFVLTFFLRCPPGPAGAPASAGSSPRSSAAVRLLLGTLAVAVALAAVWFIGLQLFVLQSVCPWCMADHALGLAMSAVLGLTLRRIGRSGAAGPSAAPSPLPQWPLMLAGGATLVCGMVLLQFFFGQTSAGLARLPAGQNAITGPSPDRQLAVLGGKLPLAPHEIPALGSARRTGVLVVHRLLLPALSGHARYWSGLQRYAGQYAVLLLPARSTPAAIGMRKPSRVSPSRAIWPDWRWPCGGPIGSSSRSSTHGCTSRRPAA